MLREKGVEGKREVTSGALRGSHGDVRGMSPTIARYVAARLA
jgi:hypothetical protein